MVAPKWAVDMLADSGVDSPEFDAGQLYMAAGGDDKNFESMVQRRAKREPLQYILGEWDFFDMTLQVGPGVLCPRGDTEFVTDQALQRGPFTKVLDLCSGSGCIALAIARFCKGADVTAVELSEHAYPYLQKNIATYGEGRVHPVKADVFAYQAQCGNGYDLIISNPPYLTFDEMKNLTPETAAEPAMALQAEDSGLAFYRHIAAAYRPCLKQGGLLAFEIGYAQGEAVKSILLDNGYDNIQVVKDYGQNDRFVCGTKC